jgi:ubiquinone biosynthesis monooxygenase Coq6
VPASGAEPGTWPPGAGAGGGGGTASGSGGSGGGGGGGGGSLAELELSSGRRLRARLVVGADGGGSRVRALVGLRSVGWSYRQRGLVATGGGPGRGRRRELRGAARPADNPAPRPRPRPPPPPPAPAPVQTSEPNATAWQRFLPDGPLALLPVRGGCSNIVWTNTPEGAARLEGMSSEEFAGARAPAKGGLGAG